MEPKFSLRDLDIIAMVQQGMAVNGIAESLKITSHDVSSKLGVIYQKLGLKSQLIQLREHQFGVPVKKLPQHPVGRKDSLKTLKNPEMMVKIRHRDGDSCFFCGNPVDFSHGSKQLESGPSIHLIKAGLGRYETIPEENRKIAHRSCNPIVKIPDRRQRATELQRKYREKKKDQVIHKKPEHAFGVPGNGVIQ